MLMVVVALFTLAWLPLQLYDVLNQMVPEINMSISPLPSLSTKCRAQCQISGIHTSTSSGSAATGWPCPTVPTTPSSTCCAMWVLPNLIRLFHWLKLKSVSSDFSKFAVNPKLKKVVELELLTCSSKIFISVKNRKSNSRNACHPAWCPVTVLVFDIAGMNKLLFIGKWSRQKHKYYFSLE